MIIRVGNLDEIKANRAFPSSKKLSIISSCDQRASFHSSSSRYTVTTLTWAVFTLVLFCFCHTLIILFTGAASRRELHAKKQCYVFWEQLNHCEAVCLSQTITALRQRKSCHSIKDRIDPYLFVVNWLCRLLRVTMCCRSQWIVRCMNLKAQLLFMVSFIKLHFHHLGQAPSFICNLSVIWVTWPLKFNAIMIPSSLL